jgi:hypothetical protein
MITFNKIRYLELLEKNNVLKNQNISLCYANSLEYDELLNYQILMEGEIYYSNKTNYIELIERYLNQSMDENGTRQFLVKFCQIFREDNKKLLEIENQILKNGKKRLNEIKMNIPNSSYFSDLIFEIYDSGEDLTREIIQKNYLEMKKL